MLKNRKNEISFASHAPPLYGMDKQRCQVEYRVYQEMPNPVWEISGLLVQKLITLAEHLPCFAGGIPRIDTSICAGCIISNCEGQLLIASNGTVILIVDKIIMIKKDEDRAIENKILSSAPKKVYKEIWMYL
jgi:hypothetical protein